MKVGQLLFACAVVAALAARLEAAPLDEPRAFALSASQTPADRIAAAHALAGVASPQALDRLMLMLRQDISPEVRAAAAEAIGETGIPYYRPTLEESEMADPDPRVRDAAARAARRLWAFSRSPRMAGGLSLICPGCGYFHLGEPLRAGAYLGTVAALVGTGLALASQGTVSFETSDGSGPRTSPTVAPLALPALMAAQNLWFYGIFASYRDARLARDDLGYRYPVSHETLTDLITAPVRPRVLRRPWFWIGLPLALGAAIGWSALVSPADLGRGVRSIDDGRGVWFLGRHYGTGAGVALGETYFAGLFLPVGVGEESLFRGVIQPGLSEELGQWPGWALSSAIFGGVHFFNFVGDEHGLTTAAKALPFLTAVGGYFGLVSIETGHQLETGVALHFWYDFLISTVGFLTDPDHQPFSLRLGMPF